MVAPIRHHASHFKYSCATFRDSLLAATGCVLYCMTLKLRTWSKRGFLVSGNRVDTRECAVIIASIDTWPRTSISTPCAALAPCSYHQSLHKTTAAIINRCRKNLHLLIYNNFVRRITCWSAVVPSQTCARMQKFRSIPQGARDCGGGCRNKHIKLDPGLSDLKSKRLNIFLMTKDLK